MKKTVTALLIFFCFLFLEKSYSKENTEPIKMMFGVHIKKINLDYKNSTFYTEFYWWLIFTNDSTKTGISNEDILELEFTNSFDEPVGHFKEGIQESRNLENSKYYYSGYHQGNFFFNCNFEDYPFDKQKLKIELENSLLTNDQFLIVPDEKSYERSQMNKNFRGISKNLLERKKVNFTINSCNIFSTNNIYNTDFGDINYPKNSVFNCLTHEILIERNIVPYITKLFIPLMIILLLVYFVFFIPAEKLDMAAGLTVTSLLSAIAFQFSINSDLPEIGYLIYVDKVFYSTYLLIVLAMAESLWTFYLDLSGDPYKIKLAKTIDVLSRILFPIIFFGLSFLFI